MDTNKEMKSEPKLYGFASLKLRLRTWVILGLAVLVAIGALSNPSTFENVSSTSTTNKSQSSTTSPVRKFTVDKGIIPDAVGFKATEVYKALYQQSKSMLFMGDGDKAIYVSSDKDLTGLEGKYVCTQDQLAGSESVATSKITFEVSADCSEAYNPMLAGKYAVDAGVWTPAPLTGAKWISNEYVEGWVFSYGDRYYAKNVEILTQYGLVSTKLAMVKPVTDWCYDGSSGDEAALSTRALSVREDLIPVGTPVRAILARPGQSNDVFIHRLTTTGLYRDGNPPVDSVNELLLKSGYWIPDIQGTSDMDLKISPRDRTWKVEYQSPIAPNALEQSYKTRIVQAANETRAAKTGAMFECIESQTKYWSEVYEKFYQRMEQNSSGGVGAGVGSGAQSNSGSGGGASISAGKCYVSGHYRSGRWVNGYWRRC